MPSLSSVSMPWGSLGCWEWESLISVLKVTSHILSRVSVAPQAVVPEKYRTVRPQLVWTRNEHFTGKKAIQEPARESSRQDMGTSLRKDRHVKGGFLANELEL